MVSISRRLQVAINYHLSVGCLSPSTLPALQSPWMALALKPAKCLGHVNSVFDMCYVDHREPLQRPRYGRMKHFFPIYHRYFSDDCIPAGLNHLFQKKFQLLTAHVPKISAMTRQLRLSLNKVNYHLHVANWGPLSFRHKKKLITTLNFLTQKSVDIKSCHEWRCTQRTFPKYTFP